MMTVARTVSSTAKTTTLTKMATARGPIPVIVEAFKAYRVMKVVAGDAMGGGRLANEIQDHTRIWDLYGYIRIRGDWKIT